MDFVVGSGLDWVIGCAIRAMGMLRCGASVNSKGGRGGRRR